MASLTNTAAFTRKVLTVIGVAVGASLLLLIIYNVGLGIYRTFVPIKPPAAFVAFGKLPALVMDEGYRPPAGVTYRIETVSGELEELPSDLKVFAIEQPATKFGDVARTNSWAQTLGFVTPPALNTGNTATFLNEEGDRILKLGITTQKGTIESDYLNNLEIISEKHEGQEAAQDEATKVMKVFGLKTVDYPRDKITYVMYKIENGKLVETGGLSMANLIQVNYFHGDLDKVPVVYPKKQQPKVWVLTSNKGTSAANIDITMIQPYKFSTYPLKGVKKAFEELKTGKAGYNDEFEGSVFDIREVLLGYLDTTAYQPYLQPVYIFRGNDNLDAYVSAVADSFVEGGK